MLLAISIVAVWGSTFASSKMVLEGGMSPMGILFFRFLGAWAILLACFRDRFFPHSWAHEFRMVLLGILGGSLYYFLQNTALLYSQSTNVSFLLSLCPLFTILLAHWILKDKNVTPLTWVGIVVAMGGVSLVITGGDFHLQAFPRGDTLAMAAAFSWAVYTILLRPVASCYTITFLSRKVFFYGWLTALPLEMATTFRGDCVALVSSSTVWLNMLFLTLFASVFCYWAWNKLIRTVGPAVLAPFLYLDAFFATIFSFLFLDEKMTIPLFCGLLLILGGVIIAGSRHPKPVDVK